MKILITGASGFVGWNAVRYFFERGLDVQPTFHSLPHYLQTHKERFPVLLDLTDGNTIEEVVSRFRPNFILHAAALARPQEHSRSTILHEVNFQGTECIARSASRYGAGLIYLSTDLVYPSDIGRYDESSPVNPSGAGDYSRTKLEGEASVREYADQWIIIRPSLMFGNGTPRSNSFTQFMERKWEKGEPAPLFTDQYRSFLYVQDLCSAIEQVALSTPAWNELFVCGGSEYLSRAEFGLAYAEACGVDPALCKPMRSTELEGYIGGPSYIEPHTDKLRSLGWQPRPLTECFAEMLQERSVAS